ncbi:MAG: sigma-54-dependent Fis family transcriptional regulator [Desulfuromonadaceae bacterium]|nr:sigma-54-dependent Fis family transcriptional regulator [Desulfuromonadaceae bacterium]
MVVAETLLPALSPQLTVVRGAHSGWLVEQVGDLLQPFVTSEPALRVSLDRAFSTAQPPLSELADEVVNHGRALYSVSVRLQCPTTGQFRLFQVDAALARQDETRSLWRVQFLFQPQSASQASVSAPAFHGLVGRSLAMQEVVRKIRLYAASDAAVVITGETGTGKELVARALHGESRRRHGPYVALNCSAIAEELLESELFGHEKGAFTGALRRHRGRFERADGGSLFLDEIGDMPLHTQTRLLRVLEERSVEPLGSERLHPVDVRVISATNVALEEAVGQGRFRSDLYHRLSVLRIHLPPLRERTQDIPLLVEVFLNQLAASYGRRVERLTPEALNLLQSYLWPGNIRELRNVMERVFVENQAPVIGARAFSEWVRERQKFAHPRWDEQLPQPAPVLIPPYPDPASQAQLRQAQPVVLTPERIREAYQACQGNLAAAARRLGVHRATLYRHLKKMRLERDELN